MDRLSVDIFIPQETGFRLSPNRIVFGLWFITLVFLWLFDGFFPADSYLRGIIIGIDVFVSLFFLGQSYLSYEPLDGTIQGTIVFKSDSIVVNEKVYDLKMISKLDFAFNDYYGRMMYGTRGFNSRFSQGVDNFVEFKDSSQQTVRIYFRMQDKHGARAFYSFINDAVQCGAMSYYRAIDLIDVENVRKPGTSN